MRLDHISWLRPRRQHPDRSNLRPTEPNEPRAALRFRHTQHGRRHDSGLYRHHPARQYAWVEFYSERNFDTDEGTGQIFRIDYARRQERNYRIFGEPDFNDKAKSVRWCIPSGSSFQVFHDLDFTGPSGLLLGSGHVRGVASFQNQSYPIGGTNLDNSITSGMFRVGVSSSADAIPGVPDSGN